MKFVIEIDDKQLAEVAVRLKEIDPVVLKAITDRLRTRVLDEINTRALVEAYRPRGRTPCTPDQVDAGFPGGVDISATIW